MKSGEERRFTDDLTNIDIELQKQTSDVSITEIMQEANGMQTALTEEETKTEENSIGDGEND